MEVNVLREKLCRRVGSFEEEENDYRKAEKVLAPFLRTLKKRKRVKADILPEEHEELYLKRYPKELLARLQSSFADPVGIKTLLHETAELLKVVTKSKSANLYLTDYVRGEILLCPKYIPENKRFEAKFGIESGTIVASHVAFTKEYVISSDILGDVRFPEGVAGVGTTVKSVICIPIITNVQDNCIGILELYRDCSEQPYNLVDLQICTALTAWLGIAVEQNKAKLALFKEVEIQRQLSVLADLYFSGVIPFNKVVSEVLKITKVVANAEKGGFYVFHEPIPLRSEETLLADAYEEGSDENNENFLFKKRNKIRFVKNEPGIPGYVARTGEVVNVQDAYKDHRFDRKTDSPFFRTRSVAAFPIKNNKGVLAVLKIINNVERPYFPKEDVDLIQSYLNYMGPVCGYYLLDTAYTKTQLKLIETNKLLDFHTKPSSEEVAALKTLVQGEQHFPLGFFKFDWDLTGFEEDSHRYIAYAFLNSEFLEPCFDFQNLCDFLLRVRRAHRPVLFHNFDHACLVFHCAYNIIAKNKELFSAAEVVTVLLAALCHDIDHPGLTNSFISLKNDTVYKLYGDLCGEAHRYEVSLFLIQSSDLLSNVSSQNYQLICKNLKKLILGFDLAIHFQKKRKILDLINEDQFDWENPEHRLLSQNIILISSDYCTNYKPFEIVKKTTSSFYKEMYRQGDLEKSMGFSPLPLMDRSKIDLIPENQVILLTTVCVPCVEILIYLFPNLTQLAELLSHTLIKWKEIIALRGHELWKLSQALVKDKKDKKSHKVSLSSTLSSIRTLLSESRSDR